MAPTVTYADSIALADSIFVKPHAADLSSAVGVAAKATITIDDAAFPCEVHSRSNNKAQSVVRGKITGRAYKAGGIYCNFPVLASKFPHGSYRVIMQLDTTANYYAVFDHTTQRLKIYSNVGTEVTDCADISSLIFPFLAVGE
jgi:hypothetical protein